MSVVNDEGKVRNIFGFYERPLAVETQHMVRGCDEAQWSFEDRLRQMECAMVRKLRGEHADFYQVNARSSIVLNADRTEGEIVAAVTGRASVKEEF